MIGTDPRAVAQEISAEGARRIDLVADAERRKSERLQSVERIIETYAASKLANIKTGREVARELRKTLAEHMKRPVTDLTKVDLQAAIDRHVSAGHIVYANRIMAYLRAFTRWAAHREYLTTDTALALQGAGLLDEGFDQWCLNDFRRAMAIALAEARIQEGVVNRMQNHAASGSAPSAVARAYQ